MKNAPALALLLLVLGSVGCHSVSVRKIYKGPELVAAFERSEQVLAQRREGLNEFSVIDKANRYQEQIRAIMVSGTALVPRSMGKGTEGTGDVEFTAHYLSALAWQYAVQADAHLEQEAFNILLSLLALDSANGLDGYLTRSAEVRDGRVRAGSKTSRANVYDQLLFAYALAFRLIDSPRLKRAIDLHVSLIGEYWHAVGFKLRDEQGNVIEHGDLSPRRLNINRSRQLSLLVLAEAVLTLTSNTSNEKLQADYRLLRQRLLDHNYPERIQDLYIKLGPFYFPTYSSTWLNALKLHTGWLLTGHEYYTSALQRLVAEVRDQHNPFLELLVELSGAAPPTGVQASLEQRITSALLSFPVTVDDREIINSTGASFRADPKPPYVKLRRRDEAQPPLPIYQRPLSTYEWKRNQKRSDGNFGRLGLIRYTGVDYLQLYWMWRYYIITQGQVP